jgi:hypothetical protein
LKHFSCGKISTSSEEESAELVNVVSPPSCDRESVSSSTTHQDHSELSMSNHRKTYPFPFETLNDCQEELQTTIQEMSDMDGYIIELEDKIEFLQKQLDWLTSKEGTCIESKPRSICLLCFSSEKLFQGITVRGLTKNVLCFIVVG